MIEQEKRSGVAGDFGGANLKNDALEAMLAEIRKRNGPLPETQHGFSDSAITDLHKKLGASKGTSGG